MSRVKYIVIDRNGKEIHKNAGINVERVDASSRFEAFRKKKTPHPVLIVSVDEWDKLVKKVEEERA